MSIENKSPHQESANWKAPLESNIRASENLEKWNQLSAKVEKVVDRLNLGIDSGIKESVIAFNAYDLPTSQSCEGHLEPSDEHNPSLGPWVEIYPKEPEQDGWEYNDDLRKLVKAESAAYLDKIKRLLSEFYSNRDIPEDVMLCTDQIAYGFRVQSAGLKNLTDRDDPEQQERAKLYKKEMNDFTKFLKERFLSGSENI